MNIRLTAKNMVISNRLEALFMKKLSKLERYFDDDTPVNAVMSVERSRHILEVTILFDGVTLRAEDSCQDMYTAIDRVLGKLEKQIHRHRDHLSKRLRAGAFHQDETVYPEAELIPDEPGARIVRTKRFAFKPMDQDEALMQMELIGHDFYVFTNSLTNQVNVLYRRKDGDYGLIEPER